MAQPIIVADATTESCAADGPAEDHGVRPYSRRAALSTVNSDLVLPRDVEE